MRPAKLGAIGWLLVVPALYLSAYDLVSPRKLREAWRGEEALSGELDDTLACDLVTDFVKREELARKVSCESEVSSLGDVARLPNVIVDKQHRTYCLARAPKWVVLRTTQQMPCFTTPPPDFSAPVESERQRVQAAAEAELKEWADGIRTAMQSSERPTRCPQLKGAARGLGVPLLEYELLQSSGDPSWAFLTTPWLREALVDGNRSAVLKAHQRWSEERPWVAVVTSSSRAAPTVLGIGRGWGRGQLTGTISLVDAAAGQLICERAFSFRSSESLEPEYKPTYGKRYNIAPIPLLDLPTEARVTADFKRRYDSAAQRTINEMTSYAVRTSLY